MTPGPDPVPRIAPDDCNAAARWPAVAPTALLCALSPGMACKNAKNTSTQTTQAEGDRDMPTAEPTLEQELVDRAFGDYFYYPAYDATLDNIWDAQPGPEPLQAIIKDDNANTLARLIYSGMTRHQAAGTLRIVAAGDLEFLTTLLGRFPALRVLSSGRDEEEDMWWVKMHLDIRDHMVWHVIQELGFVMNELSLTERLTTVFKPVSPPPYLNGGPDAFLAWVIEGWDCNPKDVGMTLYTRMPQPPEELHQWAACEDESCPVAQATSKAT